MARRAGKLAIAGVAVVAAAVGVLLGTMVAYARKVVTPPNRRDEDVRVVSVDLPCGEIVLASTAESRMRGRYEFWFDRDAGHARLGEVIASDGVVVRRSIETVDFGRLDLATRGHLSGALHLGPWELDVPYENVVVATELGDAPAWLFAGESGTSATSGTSAGAEDAGRTEASGSAGESGTNWVIHVHGRGARRQETLRGIAATKAAGWTSLVISYRNDGEAPQSSDNRYGLGDTEWPDVAAAVQYAVGRGAERIVLFGWSMGAAIALQTVLRSPDAVGRVRGLILESAAIDWVDILRYQSALLGLPRELGAAVGRLLASRAAPRLTGLAEPIDLAALDVVAQSEALREPILLLHSQDDGFVPIDGARRLAQARPDLVEFVEFAGARHAKLWNADPVRWEAAITRWLAARAG